MADRLVNMVYFTEEDFCGDDGSILFLGITGSLAFGTIPVYFNYILHSLTTSAPQCHFDYELQFLVPIFQTFTGSVYSIYSKNSDVLKTPIFLLYCFSQITKDLFCVFLQVWTERRDIWGAVNFITGAGGFLQTIIYGYGGFRLKSSGLAFNPSLPPNVTKMTTTVHYLGSVMDVAVTEEAITFTLLFSGPISPGLDVITLKGVFSLERDFPVTVDRAKGIISVRQAKPCTQFK